MNDDRRPMSDERLAELMVKVTDGVATAMEREELMSHLKDRPGLLRELEAHAALKAVTDGWVERLQLDLVEDGHREGSMTRLEQGVGVTLFVLGASVVGGWGVFELMLAPDAPLWAKAGIGMLVAGLLVLLLSAIRWRLSTMGSDQYTKVIR